MIRCTHFHTFYGTYSGYLCILPASRHAPAIERFSVLPPFPFISRMYGLQSLSSSILNPPRRRKARKRRRDRSAADFFPGKWRKRNTRGSGTLLSLSLLQCGGGRQKNPIPSLAAASSGGKGGRRRRSNQSCRVLLLSAGERESPPKQAAAAFCNFLRIPILSFVRFFVTNAGFLVFSEVIFVVKPRCIRRCKAFFHIQLSLTDSNTSEKGCRFVTAPLFAITQYRKCTHSIWEDHAS